MIKYQRMFSCRMAAPSMGLQRFEYQPHNLDKVVNTFVKNMQCGLEALPPIPPPRQGLMRCRAIHK